MLGECLGGTSNIEEAIKCAEKAHKLESTNAEVACQLKELRILLDDIRSEERVKSITSGSKLSSLRQQLASGDSEKSKASVNDTCDALLTDVMTGGGEAAGFFLLDNFNEWLDEVVVTVSPAPEDAAVDSGDITGATGGAVQQKHERDRLLVESVRAVLADDKSCRVYLRTCGGWDRLVRCVKAIAAHPALFQAVPLDDVRVSEFLTLLGPLLRVLAAGAAGERTLKLSIASDEDLFRGIKGLMGRCDAPVDVLHGAVVFMADGLDSCCSKLRSRVLKDKSLLVDIGGTLCHLNNVVCGNASGGSKAQKTAAATAAIDCCKFVRDVSFLEEWKKNISPLSVPIVPILGTVLSTRTLWGKAISADMCRDMVEVVLESLLGCSQSELLREAFLLPLDDTDGQTHTSVHCVLELCRMENWATANGLAILMNVTIQDSEQTRRTVLNAGGVDVCLSQLQKKLASGEEYSRVRAIGLLSRLTTLPEVQDCIRQPNNYRALCSAFVRNCAAQKEAHGEVEKWVIDERSQFVRTIAAISNLSEACLTVGGELGMVEALLSCLPTPRMELQQITPTSVTLPPREAVNPILVGNVARCLMAYADDKVLSSALYTDAKLIGVEKLICMMATCTDMRVRKNIAILLAKGCRMPAVKVKIEHLRGLQMLVELQDKL